MGRVRDRRDFLQILLGGAAGVSMPALLAGQSRPPSAASRAEPAATAHAPIAATRLTDTLVLISGAGGNVIALDGPDGVMMVNGGAQERAADVLKLVADQFGGKRVQTLFNTDWHHEHTGSNEALGKAGAQIVAHVHTKQYLGAELFVEWQNRTYEPRPPHARPTKTFSTSGTTSHGAEPIEYGHLGQAHTDGDIYVFFRRANVLVAGDVLSVGTYPIADYTSGGWLGGLATASKTLLDMTDAETRVIPGTGPVQGRADLQAQHAMLVAMRDRLGKMMRQGMGTDDMLAAGVTKDFDARWGAPDLFVATSYRGLWLHVRELGGVV